MRWTVDGVLSPWVQGIRCRLSIGWRWWVCFGGVVVLLLVVSPTGAQAAPPECNWEVGGIVEATPLPCPLAVPVESPAVRVDEARDWMAAAAAAGVFLLVIGTATCVRLWALR